MISIQSLNELKGARKFGSCCSCGVGTDRERGIKRIVFTPEGSMQDISIDLCPGCMKELLLKASSADVSIGKESPMAVTEIHVDEYLCPDCGSEIPFDNSFVGPQSPCVDNYCPECGRKLYVDPEIVW